MKISILFFVAILPVQLVAQENFGPRLTAMGNNAAAIADVWAIQGNAAAITTLNSPTVSINYIRNFLTEEISTQGLAAVIPIENNFIAIGFNRYGLSSYNQNKISFAYAKRFGNQFSMAIAVNYHQLKITNYGSSNGFSANVGFYYKLGNTFNLGAYITNPTKQGFVNEEVSAPIETSINIGASYLVSDKVLLASTVSKILKNPVDVRLGMEYQIAKPLALRAGVSAKPFKQYAGFGINFDKLLIDFATTFDNNLGYSPQIALGYAF
ncbi:hypothetical protein ABIB40_000070 [Pedobacter sp. UYP30]|uniref:hypothetical protein n=1 Tax=Pedobacter sp. UYP30 TaxID=1756400 RepID=UPI003398275E